MSSPPSSEPAAVPSLPGSQRAETAAALPASTVARYAAGSLATGGFATLPGLVLVYYLTDSLGVTALAAGLIVTLAKIWDVLIDPIIGGLSDRTLARTGTRRGPMLIGAIGLPITFVLMFSVPPGLSPAAAATWVLIAFVAAATFFSMFQIPYISLPAELTDGYKERTRLLTWRVVVLTVAILLFGAGGPEIRDLFPTNPLLGYLLMAIVAAGVIGVSLWIGSSVAPRGIPIATASSGRRALSLTHYREGLRVLRDSQPFRALLATFMLQGLATGLMLAGAQYVATWVLREQGAVTILFVSLIAPALLFAPVWRWIADRFGKVRTFRIASLVFLVATIALIGMLMWPGMWILGPVAVAGAAYAGMQTMPMAMLPDVMGHDAATTGDPEGRAGVFGGVWTAGETAGMALGSTTLALVLAATGYIESVASVTVTQPATAVSGIALAFSLFPALLMLASLATLRGYRLGENDVEAAAGRRA
ncbi:MFS transporter [Leucobacter komagatae]|uniref:MFS transporter n=1 Tax=Leucobacter komagatae TaxID=55969 RepID=A0A0D0IQN2_9MICO|nr:MFS transporter [Leucobacter komagatae]KIP53332.1 MFS transporter [Leucobacter komagatae]